MLETFFLPSNLIDSSAPASPPRRASVMPKKTRKKRKSSATSKKTPPRTSLPKDLQERFESVWRRLGHLIDWCDSSEHWTNMFCLEARPYRAIFYWEAVADVVSDYMLEYPTNSPEDVLTDCLVATQYSPSPDDRERLAEFRSAWDEILCSSRQEIEAFIQADLELALQEGTYEEIARMCAADYGRWKIGEE